MFITVINKTAEITVLPTLWFYNRRSNHEPGKSPAITYVDKTSVKAVHSRLGTYYLYFQPAKDCLFTENETNTQKVSGIPNETPFVKDAFHDAIIKKEHLAALRKKNQEPNVRLFIIII